MFRLLVIAAIAFSALATASAAASATASANGRGADGARGTPAMREIVLCFEDSDIPPWRLRNHTGQNFRLLDAVAADVGVRFVYRALPWRRCQSALAAGRVDGAFANSYTPERRTMGVYPPGDVPESTYRMFTDGFVLVRRRGDAVHHVDGRIVGLVGPVGSQAGYSIVDDLRRKGVTVDEGSPDPIALLRKLADGRVGAAAVGISKMRELEASGDPVISRVEALPEPLARKDYFLIISHRLHTAEPAFVQSLWDAIAARRDAVPVEIPRHASRR